MSNSHHTHHQGEDARKAWEAPRLEALEVAMTRSGVVNGNENTGVNSVNSS